MSRYRGSLTVDVDISDLLDQLSNDALLEELKERSKHSGGEAKLLEQSLQELCEEAYQTLLRGDIDAAVLCLDRALHPKWRDTELCVKAYEKVRPPA